MTKAEEKRIARKRRADIHAEYVASGAKSYRAFALMKGDLTPMRYWQLLSKAAKEIT
jgi:hypothetical protein